MEPADEPAQYAAGDAICRTSAAACAGVPRQTARHRMHTTAPSVHGAAMSRHEPKDPLIRNLVLLGLIPRHPRSISTVALRDALATQGFDINLRSLQRDLVDKLSGRFQLLCSVDDPDLAIARQRPYRWSFAPTAQLSLPGLTPAAALAMHLAEGHLRHLLPPGVLAQLAPQFEEARRQLQGMQHNQLSRWAQRVRALPNGKALLPASVDPQVWEQVATALLDGRQLQVDYLSRAKGEIKPMTLHPRALVSRGPVSYLIATVGDYSDVRHFALHRIQRAEPLPDAARDDGFDLDAYLPTAAFTPRHGTGTVQLVADIHPDLAWTLRETPLSEDQVLEALPGSDWVRLKASVADDQETLSWVWGCGEKIQVRLPRPQATAANETATHAID